MGTAWLFSFCSCNHLRDAEACSTLHRLGNADSVRTPGCPADFRDPCTAGVSAPGSVLLAMSVTEAVVAKAKDSEHSLVRQFVFGCKPDPQPVQSRPALHHECTSGFVLQLDIGVCNPTRLLHTCCHRSTWKL